MLLTSGLWMRFYKLILSYKNASDGKHSKEKKEAKA